MKKRLLSALLALCMALALLPAAFAANSGSAGYSDSGSTTLTKLTQMEIARLLEDNPLTLPSDVFETEPSYAAPYAPGKVKQEALQAALNRLNALRRIAGLPSVALDSEWCSAAQYGAVLLSVSEFDHYPPRPADMDNGFYSIGRSATSSSNIYGGVSLTRAVDGFMDDSDFFNIDRLGHRRWQLNPHMDKVGFGFAAHGYYRWYVDEKVFDNSSSGGGKCDYNYIAWPSSGNFPAVSSMFNADTAWSVTLNPNKYQTPSRSGLTVTMTRAGDGYSWTFRGSENYGDGFYGKYFNVDTGGYGVSNCIIFRPDGVQKYEGVYTVTITGLRTRSGAAATLSYQVNFFDPKNPAPDPVPEPTSAFTDVPAGQYYTEAVIWASENGYISGTNAAGTTFEPLRGCTEAEILTLLWNAKGNPGSTARFPSVSSLPSYCQGAVNWAYEKGMIDDTFRYDTPCTKAVSVYFLWLAYDSPGVRGGVSFPDVDPDADYADAVAWASAEGIVEGSNGLYEPGRIFNRGMIATLLHRALVPDARK